MRSQEHAISHQKWARWARLLAIVTAVVAGVGGLSAISSAEAGAWLAVIGGVLVVIGVLARAIDEGLGTAKTSEDHRLAAVRFRDLQLQYLSLAQFPPRDADTAETKLFQIQAQAIQAENDSPLVEESAKTERERRERSAKEERAQQERQAAEAETAPPNSTVEHDSRVE